MQRVLDFLQTTPDKITVGRIPPTGCSARYSFAVKEATDLHREPKFYAETTSREILVTKIELDELLKAGATLDGPLEF